jgi:hypothetical protein
MRRMQGALQAAYLCWVGSCSWHMLYKYLQVCRVRQRGTTYIIYSPLSSSLPCQCQFPEEVLSHLTVHVRFIECCGDCGKRKSGQWRTKYPVVTREHF